MWVIIDPEQPKSIMQTDDGWDVISDREEVTERLRFLNDRFPGTGFRAYRLVPED